MNSVDQMMAEHAFARGLSAEHVQLLARAATVTHYEEDDYIFHEHENAQTFYLIVEGSVALYIHVPQRGPLLIQTLGAGHLLGWSWLVSPYKWHFDARAFSPVTALAFEAEDVRHLFEKNAELGCQMLMRINRVLAERLQATRLQLLDVYQAAM